jgi:hypothetical protein
MSMRLIDLQRRDDSARCEGLLDQLQGDLAEGERVRWDDTGHARIALGAEREDAREILAARLSALDENWREHIAIL